MIGNKQKIIIICMVIGMGCCFNSCKNNNLNIKSISKNPIVVQHTENADICNGLFDISEIEITPSPDIECKYSFSKQENIVDYDVSPAGAFVAVIIEQGGQQAIKFWSIETAEIINACTLPNSFKAESLVWHPRTHAIFVLGTENDLSYIYRINKTSSDWEVKPIFSSEHKLKNMIISPQPFITEYDYNTGKEHYAYRLFLGMENENNTYRIVSITEHGKRFYQVVGAEKTITKADDLDAYDDPSTMTADWALPVAFHPAGHQLIWQNKNSNFFMAEYDYRQWGDFKPLQLPLSGKTSIIPTPNGLGIISWQKNTPGIEIHIIPATSTSRQLSEYNFTALPVPVPDGKGIVGKTVTNGICTLHYVPVETPLPNVHNAWLFIHSEEELNLFQKQYGLFRPTYYKQLYEMYESENYNVRNTPSRPYLVTTDIFWELFAAAYQGIFIIKERDEAIPNFWQFINEAENYFNIHNKTSKWNAVFRALKDLEMNNEANAETYRIIKETDNVSDITDDFYYYSNLKPRGHYTSSSDMELYFKAFRYFTTILSKDSDALKELENLPTEISKYAIYWIMSYLEFIAPPNSPLIWKNPKTEIPKYSQFPKKGKSIFPLSWGFDNEIFNSVVYHDDFPEDKRIEGPNGIRVLPSGLDIAAVLGNALAENLMAESYAQYPPLRKMIANLRENYRTHSHTSDFNSNLYNQWINAMAVQWADVNTTSGTTGEAIWQTKRLQTGLATWATLRHATVLVNDRIGAECGEGGFEEILLKSPRGYVEPDPHTFKAITDLFQKLIKTSSKLKTNNSEIQAVYNGLAQRLEEAKEETLFFASIAEKERKGEKLTNVEYEKILYVARANEHLLLIFRSLEDAEFALSIPEPMAKIVDVAGAPGVSSYLMAAVGTPLEWNYIVPYYGRYQIVKGSIYSYYEFQSDELLNDEQWRERAKQQVVLPWIKPYLTSCSVSRSTGY